MANFIISSDWQATLRNLDKCEAAFVVERGLKLQYTPLAVFDLGDLKDTYNPVDTRVLAWQMGRLISDKRYRALMGNHDRVGQYDDSKNWFPMLEAAGVEVNYNTAIEVIGEDTAFFYLPYMHDKERLIKAAAKLAKETKNYKKYRRILLFHCSVKDAKFNAAGIIEKNGITLKELHTDKYDFCFGGHIHRRQKLADNAMYVGSPFAHDWGEANQSKGFVVYNSDTNAVSFVPSGIAGYYTYEWLVKHPKHVPEKGSKVKVTIPVSLKEDYYRKIEKKTNEVNKHYKNVEVFPVPKFIETETHNDVVVDLDISDYEKLKKYLAATLPVDLRSHKKWILTYLASKLTQVKGFSTKSEGYLEFLSISARNVLSYKKLKFSLAPRGVALVKGENLDCPGHSNGAGKTNLLAMIKVAACGKTLKDQKNNEWAREDVGETARVVLKFKDEQGRLIKIVRQRRPTKLQLFINGKDESAGRRHTGVGETQSLIDEVLGFTEETLNNAIFIDSQISNSFLTGTQKQRIELISRYQNIERFEQAKKGVGNDIALNKETQADLLSEIELEQKAIKDFDETIAESKAYQRDKLSSLRKELKTYIKHAKKEERSKKKIWPKLIKRRDRLHEQFNAREEKILLYDQKLYALNVKIDETANEISSARHKMELTICPVCRRPLKVEDRSDAIKFMVKEQCKYKSQKTELLRERDALKERNNKVFEKSQRAKELIQEWNASTDHAWKLVADAKEKLKEHKATSYMKYSLRKTIKQKKKSVARIVKLKKVLRHKVEDADCLAYCNHAFSRDGLPLFLNGLVIPLLNRASDSYSKLFTDGEVQVRFDLSDGLFVPNVINLHGSKTIKGQSGGETAWAGMITALSLRELAPKTNILALDEPGNGLDPEGAKQLAVGIKKLGKRFGTVFIVTHNQAIIEELNGVNSITVVKKNGVSFVKK